MGKLYSLSSELRETVLAMARLVEEKLQGVVKFDEYIVLPDYGKKIVIRFNLIEYSIKYLEELDEIENSIRNILGDDFWGNLVGRNFEKFGFNKDELANSLKNIDLNIDDKVINYKDTSYCKFVKRDREEIRKLLDLSSQQKIWEIQVSGYKDIDGLILIVDESFECEGELEVLSEKNLNIEDQVIRAVICKNHKSFNGIIKAYFIAEHNNISLNHVIIQYQ